MSFASLLNGEKKDEEAFKYCSVVAALVRSYTLYGRPFIYGEVRSFPRPYHNQTRLVAYYNSRLIKSQT